MVIKNYNKVYNTYFENEAFIAEFRNALNTIKSAKKIFFIGNGGSNSICSHMMEDFAKVARFQTFAFSDPALITCFSNDYGYENAMKEWLKIYLEKGDLLVAISSSGNSPNINNAVDYANELGANIITLSGFKENNKLNGKGHVNFHIEAESYGIVECFHQVILHALLDEHVSQNLNG
ncbi:SIS domain-containing protein [Crocinitomix algicola]|uniref:SIS domain-containing protein n=1 Tax=Crocinitomix algicola TaxID=1740263 RepID=UPI000833709E|nr:SIS domain-containing protein [Crocinitomix algicola]